MAILAREAMSPRSDMRKKTRQHNPEIGRGIDRVGSTQRDDLYIVPRELAFFHEGARVLVVSADPPGWAIINRDAARLLETMPKGKAFTVSVGVRLAISSGLTNVDADHVSALMQQLADSYVVQRVGETPEQPTRELVVGGIYFELTSRCNLRCNHCYVDAGAGTSEEMSSEEVLRVVHQIDPPSEIGFSGGEPLLREDCLSLVTTVAQEGYRCTVLTNGLLINRALAKAFAANGITVQVSLEASHPDIHDALRGPGTWERAADAIRYLVEAGCPVRVSFTPTKINADDFESYVAFSQGLGVRSIHVCTFTPQGRGKRNQSRLQLDQRQLMKLQLAMDRLSRDVEIMGGLPEMLDLQRVGYRWDCCPLGGSIRIGSDGSIYPCEIAAESRFIIGNAKKCRLSDALASPAMTEFVRNSRERIELIPRCKACIWRHFCGGGCMVLSYSTTTNLNTPDYYCALRRFWFPKLLWRRIDALNT